jgi:hypothetical protein
VEARLTWDKERRACGFVPDAELRFVSSRPLPGGSVEIVYGMRPEASE